MDDEDLPEFDEAFWEGVYRRAERIRDLVDRMLLDELCALKSTPYKERRCRHGDRNIRS